LVSINWTLSRASPPLHNCCVTPRASTSFYYTERALFLLKFQLFFHFLSSLHCLFPDIFFFSKGKRKRGQWYQGAEVVYRLTSLWFNFSYPACAYTRARTRYRLRNLKWRSVIGRAMPRSNSFVHHHRQSSDNFILDAHRSWLQSSTFTQVRFYAFSIICFLLWKLITASANSSVFGTNRFVQEFGTRSSSLRKIDDDHVLSSGLFDLHSLDTELLPEVWCLCYDWLISCTERAYKYICLSDETSPKYF